MTHTDYRVHLTLKSRNEKTGPIPVSTTSATTCASACPFASGNGCYADGGPLAIHWRKVTTGLAGKPWVEFVEQIAALPVGQIWRHNQAGDLPGNRVTIDREALSQLVAANRGRRGFTYTHKPLEGDGNIETHNRAAVRGANAAGFTINLSANSLSHADRLVDLQAGPVVSIVPENTPATFTTPAGRKGIVCPAQQRDDITCATCQLCSRAMRSVIIGFRAHGNAKRKAEAIAKN